MGIYNILVGKKDKGVREEINVASTIEDERKSATLESVNSCVMVTDERNIIVDVNAAALNLMRDAEADLRKELPNFSAAGLVGSNMGMFQKDPAHQISRLETLSSRYKDQITVGARTFELTANPIFNEQKIRLGTVVEWFDATEKLSRKKKEKLQTEQEKKIAAANARIRSALDRVSSNVMLADADGIIVYANDSVKSMLRAAESDIRTEIGSFSADKIVGCNFDIFHKNPAHQRNLLGALSATYRAQIAVGNRTFKLVVNPVFDDENSRQGTVIEWSDLTSELAFENVVDSTISAAVAGELSGRIDLVGREGFIAKISTGINRLLDIFEKVLNDTSASISELSEGRLTRMVATEYSGSYDKLKHDINQTIAKLVEVVSEISETGMVVKEYAREISSGNANLSQRTEEQAASLEETSAAMEQITTTVQQNAANASQANTLARGARETAENGGAVVGKAISAMEAISKSSNKINDIIGVIDEIAFQTNLLALNAAVEAARAGDQGRGFAVVADEVRSLAGRSATAAKEIKELIRDSSERVQEGSDLVNKSGETLEEIVIAVKKVNDIVAEISTASDEQTTGLDEISKALGEMDEMTQQNSALVEEAAAASEALGNQAENLDKLISFFDTGVRAKRPTTGTVVAKSTRLSEKRVSADKPALRRANGKPKAKPVSRAKFGRQVDDEDRDWSEF